MTQHLNEDAERISMIKRSRKSITVILCMTLVMLAITIYKLLF